MIIHAFFHNESRNHKEQFPAQSVPLGHIISIEFGTTNLDRRTPDLSSLDGSYSVPPPKALAQELLTDGPLYVSLLLYEERETCSMIRRPAKHVVTLLGCGYGESDWLEMCFAISNIFDCMVGP